MNTPRTDAEFMGVIHDEECVMASFARQLERELTAEQEKVKQLREALEKIKIHAFSDSPAEELEDAQRDLRHVYETARAILEKTK